MSGVLHKVKNALQAEKNTPEAAAANQGKNGAISAFFVYRLRSFYRASASFSIVNSH